MDPRDAYTQAMKVRFSGQRKLLYSMSEAAVVNKTSAVREPLWKLQKQLVSEGPRLQQVARMSQQAALQLLRKITESHLPREHTISVATSAWIWALLARLSEVGSMNNDQVAIVRELGKQAILVQLSLDDPTAAAQLDELSQTGATTSDNQNRSEESGSSDDDARDVSFAALDAIIFIVGDIFGQRDLLEFRKTWELQQAASD